jgi:predicted methyltransferase
VKCPACAGHGTVRVPLDDDDEPEDFECLACLGTGLDSKAVNKLIRTWQEWDRRPRNEDAARAYEAACQEFASGHATRLRAHLAAQSRAGLSRRAAIESWPKAEPDQ